MKKEFIKIMTHKWKHLVLLENHLLDCERYVSFEQANFKSFSSEFLNIIVATCSIVDSSIESFILGPTKTFIDLSKGEKNEYHKLATTLFLEFKSSFKQEIDFTGSSSLIKISPWPHDSKGFKKTKWWDAYNDIKHKFKRDLANLENTLSSFCGAVLIILFLLGEAVASLADEKTGFLWHPAMPPLTHLHLDCNLGLQKLEEQVSLEKLKRFKMELFERKMVFD